MLFLLQIMGITTDNATNNNRFINLLANWAVEQEHNIFFNKTENHFCCFAHIINLSIQKALDILESRLEQVYIVNLYLYFYIIN
jgi:hypothetical protein